MRFHERQSQIDRLSVLLSEARYISKCGQPKISHSPSTPRPHAALSIRPTGTPVVDLAPAAPEFVVCDHAESLVAHITLNSRLYRTIVIGSG